MPCRPDPLETYRVRAQLPSFRRRVLAADAVLRSASERGPIIVATSWGKDSTALADLAVQTLGRVPLLHIASSYRLPGWQRVHDHFAARTEVVTIEPRRTLTETLEWLHAVGLPHERTRSQQAAVVSAIKKDVGTTYCQNNGYAVQALGMRAEENPRTRGRLFRVRGLTYEARGLTIVNPIGWWTAADVWSYIADRGLPYHPMYDCESHGLTRETLRNAGWLTTDSAERGRIAWLRTHFREQYRLLEREFPQVKIYA